MSELTITLLRLGYLALLWVLVLSSIAVLRRDLYGTRITKRRARRRSRQIARAIRKMAPQVRHFSRVFREASIARSGTGACAPPSSRAAVS